MRLICPNCGAQYEVDDKVIPDTGRDVQCSNCGHTWFQQPAHMDMDLADELGDDLVTEAPPAKPRVAEARVAAPPPPPLEKPKARGIDPDIASVLREEAKREAEARRKDSESLESQPELGFTDEPDVAADRSAAARARMARLRGGEENDAEAAAAIAAAATTGARRDLLPDIEEINSTLRASQDRTRESDPAAGVEMDAQREKSYRGGFRLGFGVIVIAIGAGIVLYAFAPQISQAIPATEPFLINYVAWANTVREQINGGVDQVIGMVNGLISGSSAE